MGRGENVIWGMRLPRVILPGVPLHVTHRGNRGSAVFFDDSDRQTYLSILRDYSDRFGLEVWAYCLMTNHVHLLVLPRFATAPAMAIGVSHRLHSRRVNARNGWLGHLWANRYFSTVLDEHHLW
jgi:putative transposase